MVRPFLAALAAASLCYGMASPVLAQSIPEAPAPEPAPESPPVPQATGSDEAQADEGAESGPSDATQSPPLTAADEAPATAPVEAPATPAAPAAQPSAATPPAPAPANGPVIEMPQSDVLDAEEHPDAAAEAPLVQSGAPRSQDLGVTLGGYGQHEFIAAEGEDTRFRNHRYVLFIFGRIHDRITTSTELELEFAGSPLKKDGTLGPGEVLLEYSVLDIELFPWLSLRGGVILVPVSSFNLHHDAPTRELVDRPIAYTSVVPTTWFESGAGAFGKLELSGDQTLAYELYMVNGLDAKISDGTGLRAARGSHFEDNNSDKALVGRIAYQPIPDLELGVSGYTGDYDKRDNRINLLNLDFRVRFHRLELLGEAVYVHIDEGFVEGFPESSVANTRMAVPTGMWGFFGQVHYHIPVPGLLAFEQATLTPVLRYEGKDTDDEHDSALGDQRRLTLGVNFRPIPQVVVKSDFQWNASGEHLEHGAPDIWKSGFWHGRDAGFLFDSYIASVAYLF